jgi:cytidylate kinase
VSTAGSGATGPPLIAIDGLGAVGKSTVGPIVARRLGYRFVDSGELYRALTWLALHRAMDTGDEPGLARLAAETRLEIEPSPDGERRIVFVDRLDVTAQIHTRKVDTEVGNVSRLAGVRRCLILYQRDMARDGRLVMAGRDIGTVVLPQAHLKIFLVASPEERARRRHLERQSAAPASYEEVLADMKKRDAIDSTRELSPTLPALDARVVDTERLTPWEVADRILAMAKEAI